MSKSGIPHIPKGAGPRKSKQNNEELARALKARLLKQTMIWLVVGVLGAAVLIWTQMV